MFGFLKKAFDPSKKELAGLAETAAKVAALEPSMKPLTDEQLLGLTAKFRERLAGGEPIDSVLPEAFAAIRHPKLRIYIMHGGWPYLQETKAIMSVYPQVYADLAVINWIIPREEFHEYLRGLIRAGLGKRIMFGSDQMIWPEAIGMAIEGIESATFLSYEQKRDIYYNNAARFLRLQESGE